MESRSAPIEPLPRRAATISRDATGRAPEGERNRRRRKIPVRDGRHERGMPVVDAEPTRTDAGGVDREGWAKTCGRQEVGPVTGSADAATGPASAWEGTTGAAVAGPVSRTPGDGCPGR
jgi:hypothetical protein